MTRKKIFCLLSIGIYCVLLQGQKIYVDQLYAEITKSTFTYADTLKLDYYTATEADSNKDRPLIILVHGGGFSGGSRDNPVESKFCETMASKGYAVTSMSYNLTRKGKSTGFGCDCPAVEKIETFKQTTEDILNAIKFLKENTKVAFHPERIILVGSSAGAEGVLITAYLSQHPAFNDLPFSQTDIAAVISFSGAVLDSRYINNTNLVPAFLIHGKKDKLVPYATAAHHYCNPEDAGYLMLDGSSTIAQRLKDNNASYYLLSDPEGSHDWANLGYQYTSEIAEFINDVVMEKKTVQRDITATTN